MKRLLVAVSAALILAGCSPAPAADPPSTPAPTAATPSLDAPERAFIEAFRSENPDADRATDEQWLSLGDSVCLAFESGASANQIVDQMQGNVEAHEAASAVVFAAEHLCPEFAP